MKIKFTSVDEELPRTLEDVIALNINSGEMEFGFRSGVDIDQHNWADFSFDITHWAYAEIPSEED